MRLRIVLMSTLWVHPAVADEQSALKALVAMTAGDRGNFIDGGRAHFLSRRLLVKDSITNFERTVRSSSDCVYHVIGHYRISYTDKPTVIDATFTAIIDYSTLQGYEIVRGQPGVIRLKGGAHLSCQVNTINGTVQPEVCLNTSTIDGIDDFSRWRSTYNSFRSQVCLGPTS